MSELSINTTQNVNINFTAASVGERLVAHLLDFIVKLAYIIVILYFVFNLMGLGNVIEKLDNWSATAVVMLFALPYAFYSLTLECLFEGQTLGKRIVKIKVVKIDGYQASFGDYLMRWLLRLIDIWTNMGVIGLVSIVVTDKTQRLGDLSAGTAVISLRNKVTINSTILEEIGEEYVPIYPLVIKLSDNDVRIIKDTFNLAVTKGDSEMITKLKTKIETVTGIKNQSGNNKDFIRTVLKDYNFYTQNM
jgi:uncharacterized RDD family membrane protein YckC